MDKIVFGVTLLISLNLYGQKFSGEIIYNIDNNLEIKTDTMKSPFKKVLIKILQDTEDVSDITFKLEFDNESSYFKYIPEMEVDNNTEINMFKFEAETRGEIITDFKKKITFSKSDSENLIIIDSLDRFNWQLLNERKKINGYVCYKALGERKVYRRSTNSYKTLQVIAWYCQELNFPTGPSGYGGLPGLILALEEVELQTFYASKIKIGTKNKKVKKTFRGNKISRQDYNQKSRRNYKNGSY